MNNKIKGYHYELQCLDYLILNYDNYYSYLWKNVPLKYIIKYVFDDLTKYENINDFELNIENNNVVDIGCDIFMVNKDNEDDVIIVQCKNYKDKNVCIDDLSGFFHLIALSHLPIKGIIMSNSDICNRIINKLKFIEKVIIINLKYEEKQIIIKEEKIIPKEYQLEAVKIFKKMDKGILQLFCGMGKTFTSILISKNYNNILILSPMRSYASQLLENFEKYLKEYSGNLISSDGTRNIDIIINNKKNKNIYSATFCSADIVLELINKLENTILIIDEFHNLSYKNITDNNDNINKIITSDKINKKLFMSATPKIYEILEEDNIIEHNVDNYKKIFGNIFYSYSFTKAIENKYINNYQIILPNEENEKNKYEFIYFNMLYHGYKKCLIYCKNLKETKEYLEELENINKNKYNFKCYINVVNYKTSLNKRNKIIEEFKSEKYKLSFIISVHTLDECIDVPICDSVYITYNINNSINIIQKISRCLRIYKNKIKSGIFLWCDKYSDLEKIINIIYNYDNLFANKIYIKTDNSKKKDTHINKIKNYIKNDNVEVIIENINNIINTKYSLEDEIKKNNQIEKLKKNIIVLKKKLISKISCNICGLKFINKDNFVDHISKKNCVKNKIIEKQKNNKKEKKIKKNNKKTKENIKYKYICNICGHGFKQKGHFTDHANRKFPCKNNKTLIDNETVINNEFVINNIKKYKYTCNICGHGFKQKGHFTDHMNRKFPCKK